MSYQKRGQNQRSHDIKKTKYEAVKRLVRNNQVVGFMLRPLGSKSNSLSTDELFVEIDTVVNGIENGYFEIKNVKLGINRKPRGYNGFLLSKLPIVELMEPKEVESNLREVVEYIFGLVRGDELVEGDYFYSVKGLLARYRVKAKLDAYSGMSEKEALDELQKTLRFYKKNIPEKFKGKYDNIIGEISRGDGSIIITVKKNLLKSE